jgi:hypothetical protein
MGFQLEEHLPQGSMDDKNREIKKRWKKAEKDAARSMFPLPNDKLKAMFGAVEIALEDAGCDHSLRATTEWLNTNGVDVASIVAWLKDNGGFCDCEVVANARERWEENR